MRREVAGHADKEARMAPVGRIRIGARPFGTTHSKAEEEFHRFVRELVHAAKARGEPPEQIRIRLMRNFLNEPHLRRADIYEQEHVVAGLRRTIDSALGTE
jgi:hypothetical protein